MLFGFYYIVSFLVDCFPLWFDFGVVRTFSGKVGLKNLRSDCSLKRRRAWTRPLAADWAHGRVPGDGWCVCVCACPGAYHVFVVAWADSLCMTIDSPRQLRCQPLRCFHGRNRRPKPSRRKWSVASLVRKSLPTKMVRFVGVPPAGLAPGEKPQNSLDSPFTPGQ